MNHLRFLFGVGWWGLGTLIFVNAELTDLTLTHESTQTWFHAINNSIVNLMVCVCLGVGTLCFCSIKPKPKPDSKPKGE